MQLRVKKPPPDLELSSESENAVQNKVITKELNKKFDKINITESTTETTNDKAASAIQLNPNIDDTLANKANKAIYNLYALNKSYYPDCEFDYTDLNNCIASRYVTKFGMYIVDCDYKTLNTPNNETKGTCICIPESLTSGTIQLFFTGRQTFGDYNSNYTGIFIRRVPRSGSPTEWLRAGLEKTFYVSSTKSYLENTLLKKMNAGSLVYVEAENILYFYNGTELKQVNT